MALDLADLDLDLGADRLVAERLQQAGNRLVLLRLATHVDLGPAMTRLGLDDESPCARRTLAQVALGEILAQAIELLLGFGIPTGIHQESDHALALARVLRVNSTEQGHDDRARHLIGLLDAEPEPIDPAIFDHMWADFDDRLLHAHRPTRLRAEIAELPATAIVPRFRLDSEHFLGHRAGVDDHRLDQ